MIPKLTFEVIDNPDNMIKVINGFLLGTRGVFDWRYIYAREYPEIKELLAKSSEPEEIRKASEDFFKKLYYSNLTQLEKIKETFELAWAQDEDKLMAALSKVLEKDWPEDCKTMKAWISLNPICPRFLKQRSFDLYWKFSPEKMKVMALHEILHFLWFEKWKDVFPNFKEKEFESPNLIWKLSEIVPLAILGDKRIQSIFKHEPSVYREWRLKKINGKPLLEQIQKLYTDKKSMADFMKKSLDFLKANESELNLK